MAASGTDIYAGTWNNLWRTTNNGTSWTKTGMVDNGAYSITTNGTNIFIGTIPGIYLSTNNGVNWNWVLRGSAIAALTMFGNKIFAGDSYGAVHISTNNGANWSYINLQAITILSFITKGTNIFAGTERGVYLSSDSGSTWAKVNNGLTSNNAFTLAVKETDLFVGTGNGNTGVFLSTDNGATWKQVNNGLTSNNVNSFAVTGTNIFAGAGSSSSLIGGVFISTNNGTNWSSVGMVNENITSLVINDNNIYAGTYNGQVWRRPLSELVDITREGNVTPKNFSLSQNFPNPFNPSTKIKYSLPKASHVSLSIYNSMGQEVSKLISKEMNAGVYTTEWNASGFASGVYYCRMVAGDFVQTRKLLLLK